jgi:hypothetical protein
MNSFFHIKAMNYKTYVALESCRNSQSVVEQKYSYLDS